MTATVRGTERNREWLWVGLLVALAFAVRLGLVLFVDRVVWGDEPFYLWLGRNWLTGHGYSFTGYSDVHHTPGYPFIGGVFYLLTGNLESASDVAYVLFGTLLALPVYGLARRIYNRQVGYVALLLLAVYPALTGTILFWGTMTEPPYYFFAYAAMFGLLIGMERAKLWPILLSGVALGAAYLVRPEGVAYVAILLFYLLVLRLFEKRLLTRRTGLELLTLLLGFALLFMPYAIYVRLQTGAWMVSEKAGVTFITSWRLAYGDTAAFDKATWGLDSTGLEVFFFSTESYHVSMVQEILAAPLTFVKLVYQNVITFLAQAFSPRMFPYFFLPLAALGLFKSAWDRVRAKRELLLILSLLPVMAFLVFFIQERYIAALLPTLIIWLAAGLQALGEWLAGTWQALRHSPRAPRWQAAAVWVPSIAIALFLAVAQPQVMQNTAVGSFRFAHKTVGLWMKDAGLTDEDTVVMARYPAVAVYADSKWEPTPNATWPEILRYARHVGADYFVLDAKETESLRPQLAFLTDEQQIPPELELVHVDTSEGSRMFVYRIQPAS